VDVLGQDGDPVSRAAPADDHGAELMRCRICNKSLAAAPTGRPARYCSARCRMVAYRQRRKRHKVSVHFSSRSCEWSTPQDLFDRLHAEHQFTLDVCATTENAKCERYFTRAEDGLAQTWTGRVWCNPPYGREIPAWMRKAWESAQSTAELVVALVPARPGSRWFQDYVMPRLREGDVELMPGRLRFGGAEHSAPFDSAVVVFRNANLGRLSVTEPVTKPLALVG
jgi:site-specific DNA-methyltransferase (adenine-specific)